MTSKPTIYWDACMFYEVLGDEPVTAEKRAAVQEILEQNAREESIIITSIITHLEVLPKKLTAKDADDERDYLSLFDGVKFVDQEINRNVLLRAREIRDFYHRPPDANGVGSKMMDAADALHLATASIYGATAFHTRDDDHRGTKVPLVSLYAWSGVDKLCGKYELLIESPENIQKVLPFEAAQDPAPGN